MLRSLLPAKEPEGSVWAPVHMPRGMMKILDNRCLVALALAFCAGASLRAQDKSVAARSVLGVKLSPAATALLKEVEKEYRKKVEFREDAGQRLDNPAKFHIEGDGDPSITINPTTGRNEESIVHELMHLKGIAMGVPWVNFHGDKPVNQEVVEFARTNLYDMIFHAYFYPELRALGFGPEVAECEWLRTALHDRKPLPTARGSIMHASLALYYFRARHICGDRPLANQLKAILEATNQHRAASEGEAIEEIVERIGLAKPRDVLDVFLAAANELFKGELEFSLTEAKPLSRGNIKQVTALIKIRPLDPN